MALDGWIKLWRKLLENEVLQHETRFSVFVRLLLKASHEPASVWFKGQERPVGKGQCWISERDEARALKCDRQKIRTALSTLEQAGMLSRNLTQSLTHGLTQEQTHRLTQGATHITICNYDYYQSREMEANPATNPASNLPLTHEMPTEQEGKKERRKESEGGAPNGAAEKYAFLGKTVRVLWPQYREWEAAFPHIDLRAYLQNRDDWYQAQPEDVRKNWFIPTSNWLRAKNDEAAAKRPKRQMRRQATDILDDLSRAGDDDQ